MKFSIPQKIWKFILVLIGYGLTYLTFNSMILRGSWLYLDIIVIFLCGAFLALSNTLEVLASGLDE